ncbi:hypothetical protein NDU88_001224 [Pleurodeles waltl]|uniref:Uncharacterized protein n=1 Tax=Pleurodeles waltl TaxID=8319 RepID=A0AAV7R945_PLEWA|nr:hypothetical protein NDU88_001224 [Pleurodeles waltl]
MPRPVPGTAASLTPAPLPAVPVNHTWPPSRGLSPTHGYRCEPIPDGPPWRHLLSLALLPVTGPDAPCDASLTSSGAWRCPAWISALLQRGEGLCDCRRTSASGNPRMSVRKRQTCARAHPPRITMHLTAAFQHNKSI